MDIPLTKMNIRHVEQTLEKLAEEIGCNTHVKFAQTGTIYLTVHNPLGNSMTIRIADHADAYGRADYTCDNFEGTLVGAKNKLIELRKTSWTAVRRLQKLRRNYNRRGNEHRRENWIQGVTSQWPDLYPTRESAEKEADVLFRK